MKERKWKFFWIGLIVGIVIVILVPLAVVASGMVNMGASSGPGVVETALASWALDSSVERHAAEVKNPFAGNAKAVEYGLDHYKENCAICHVAPGIKATDIAQGLNPPPPDLWTDDAQEASDSEMFWIVKNGIRMTGMPAFGKSHSDDMIWHMITFVRHLPKLTDEERKQIEEVVGEEESHLQQADIEAQSQPASSMTQPASQGR